MVDQPETDRVPDAEAEWVPAPRANTEQEGSNSKPEPEAPDAQLEQGAPDRPELPEVLAWAGHKLDEMHGASVGRIDGAYVDAEGGEPEWLLVRMGRFGHHTLVPA